METTGSLPETILIEVGELHLPKPLQGQEESVVAVAIAKVMGFDRDGFSTMVRQGPILERDTFNETAIMSRATFEQYEDVNEAWLEADPDLRIRRIYERPNETWSPTNTFRVTRGPNIEWSTTLFTKMVEDLQRTYPDRSMGARLNAGLRWITRQVSSTTATRKIGV